MAPQREAFFLPAGDGGHRFCLYTPAHGDSCGGLLYLPPFAEEMNKSRRMAALAARAFAEQGWSVLQIDLCGCGDSSGDFGDATWDAWLEDVAAAWSWLRSRCSGRIGLWSLRAGSLLASDWLQTSGEHPPWLMWQPVANGRQHLNHFLRLKAASEMLVESDAKAVMAALRAELEAGKQVEVAGYRVAPPLGRGMEASVLRLPAGYRSAVSVIEVVSGDRKELSAGLSIQIGKWEAGGVPVVGECVQGPSFWQTVEIETAAQLIGRSIQRLARFRE